ncbi:hypothetical protein KO465_04920 [Candidatus Micrarchaeota archaeon]|nr:hypothetical protein [Candidatus Micrarchaeota archaeon]
MAKKERKEMTMIKEITVLLDKPARKKGADKYTNKAGDFTIYIPQYISREINETPARKFKVTMEGE